MLCSLPQLNIPELLLHEFSVIGKCLVPIKYISDVDFPSNNDVDDLGMNMIQPTFWDFVTANALHGKTLDAEGSMFWPIICDSIRIFVDKSLDQDE